MFEYFELELPYPPQELASENAFVKKSRIYERPLRADFAEKIFFFDALVCVIALIYWDVRGRRTLLLKGGAYRLDLSSVSIEGGATIHTVTLNDVKADQT